MIARTIAQKRRETNKQVSNKHFAGGKKCELDELLPEKERTVKREKHPAHLSTDSAGEDESSSEQTCVYDVVTRFDCLARVVVGVKSFGWKE